MEYEATQWRKRMERKPGGSWRRFTNTMLPNCVIEYHIIHGGRLYSGRCRGGHRIGDVSVPGTPAYVVGRRDLMTEGVWRRACDQYAGLGQVIRPLPY